MEWLVNKGKDTDPNTGATLPTKTLIPQYALKQAIEEWQRALRQ